MYPAHIYDSVLVDWITAAGGSLVWPYRVRGIMCLGVFACHKCIAIMPLEYAIRTGLALRTAEMLMGLGIMPYIYTKTAVGVCKRMRWCRAGLGVLERRDGAIHVLNTPALQRCANVSMLSQPRLSLAQWLAFAAKGACHAGAHVAYCNL